MSRRGVASKRKELQTDSSVKWCFSIFFLANAAYVQRVAFERWQKQTFSRRSLRIGGQRVSICLCLSDEPPRRAKTTISHRKKWGDI